MADNLISNKLVTGRPEDRFGEIREAGERVPKEFP